MTFKQCPIVEEQCPIAKEQCPIVKEKTDVLMFQHIYKHNSSDAVPKPYTEIICSFNLNSA